MTTETKFHQSIEEQIMNMSQEEKRFLAQVRTYDELEGEYKDKVDAIIAAVDLTDDESVVDFGQEMVERVSGISDEAKAYLIDNGYYTDEGDLGLAFKNALQGKMEDVKNMDKDSVINKVWDKATSALTVAGKAKDGVTSWFKKSHEHEKKRKELKESTEALRETLEKKSIESKTITKKAQRNIDEIDQAITLIDIQWNSRMNASTELKFYVIAANRILNNYTEFMQDDEYSEFDLMNIEANKPNLQWRAKILTASYGKAMYNCKMLAQDKARERLSRQVTLDKKNNAANDLKQGIFYGAMQEKSAQRILETAEWDASGIEMTEKVVAVRAKASEQLSEVASGDDLALEELKAMDKSVQLEKHTQEKTNLQLEDSYKKATAFIQGKGDVIDAPQLSASVKKTAEQDNEKPETTEETSEAKTTAEAVKENVQDADVMDFDDIPVAEEVFEDIEEAQEVKSSVSQGNQPS